jgi:hypothetical protein
MLTNTNIVQPTRVVLGIEVLLLFTLTVFTRAVFLDHEPIHDELYHLLAAQSWVSEGTFRIAGGEYNRGGLYTAFVGTIYNLFGEEVRTIRWSSVLVGSLWVVAVFAWCRFKFDRGVAWTAALLFCLAPGAIFLSQYIRFYVLHGLLFWLLAVGAFEIIERRVVSWKMAVLAVGVLAAFLAAAHLQQTTLVGLAGIIVYAAFRILPEQLRKAATDRSLRRWLIGLAGLAVVAAAAVVVSGVAAAIIEKYLWAPAWANKSGFLRYHWLLVSQYPLFWGVLPIAVLVILARRSLTGAYCAAIFCTAVLLHSFAGMKGERFIYYAMPFFFVVSALFLKEVFLYTKGIADDLIRGTNLVADRFHVPIAGTISVFACLFLLLANPAFRYTADMLRGQPVGDGSEGQYWSRYEANWERAASGLLDLSDTASVVVSPSELHMLYYFGRVDFELSFSRLTELIDGKWKPEDEFTIDFRTGRAAISSPESLELVVSCFESGLLVVRNVSWLNPAIVPSETRGAIEDLLTRVDVPADWGLIVYAWEGGEVEDANVCDRVRVLRTSSSPIADTKRQR